MNNKVLYVWTFRRTIHVSFQQKSRQTRSKQHSTQAFFMQITCFGTILGLKEKGLSAIWAHRPLILDEVKACYLSGEFLNNFFQTLHPILAEGKFLPLQHRAHEPMLQKQDMELYSITSHEKWAPDGVGGLLKRTADKLVSQGHAIPSAEQLYNAL